MDLEEKIKKVHTVGYWDKPNNKDIKNWMGVVTPKSIDATTVYPKEQALVDICKLHKSAGHQVWVYCQMTGKRNVMPRLKEILSKAGLKVGIMRADDVEPKEREEWIAKHGREFDVMICFPQLVSTGLDLFSKVQGGHNYNCIVFYETGYKLNMMRQAARRAWRIGQPRDCYIYYMYYQGYDAASCDEPDVEEDGGCPGSRRGVQRGRLGRDGWRGRRADGPGQVDVREDRRRRHAAVVVEGQESDREEETHQEEGHFPRSPTWLRTPSRTQLDTLEEEAQLLARTILERQKKPVPTSAMPDIISLAERFAKADEGMWGAARAMAFREEPTAEFIVPATEDTPKGTPVVGKFTVTNGEGNMLFEGENTIVTVGQNDVLSGDVRQRRPMSGYRRDGRQVGRVHDRRGCRHAGPKLSCPPARAGEERYTQSSTTSSSTRR